MVEGKCRDSEGYEENDAVFVEGVAFSEDG